MSYINLFILKLLVLLQVLFYNGLINAYAENSSNNKIMVISVPKSGSNLMGELVNLITGKIPISHQECFFLATGDIKDSFFELPAKAFMCTHIFYTEKNIAKINSSGFKCLFIKRDPRDTLASYAQYLNKKSGKFYVNSMAEIVDWLINDIPLQKLEWKMFPQYLNTKFTLFDFYNHYSSWVKEPTIFTVKFESLLGDINNNCVSEEQTNEIIKIANYLDINLDSNRAYEIAEQLIESRRNLNSKLPWENLFSEKNKQDIKANIGQLLIDWGYEKDLNW